MDKRNFYCPSCGSHNNRCCGYDHGKQGKITRYVCKDCGKKYNEKTGIKKEDDFFEYENPVEKTIPTMRKIPNVLLLDVETTPMEVFVWGLYKQRINPNNVIKDWNLLSWAAKWLFQKEMHSDVLTPREAVTGDDKRICASLYKLIEQADVVIAHNGVRFDIRKINARFMLHRFPKPSPYQIIDTLRESQRLFAFSSHKLDYLGKIMVQKQKLETDFQLWIDCLRGNEEALLYMMTYNVEDVLLLEEVYMEIRGWIPSHPNLALYAETTEECCPVCLSPRIEEYGEYVTPAGVFESFRCVESNCNSVFRKRKSILSKEMKNRTFIPSAR